MLTEIKNQYYHYFKDENGLLQGPYKQYNPNDMTIECGCFKDSKKHGECILYCSGSSYKIDHFFYIDNQKVPYPVTPEDRMYFKLKCDFPLPEEPQCQETLRGKM